MKTIQDHSETLASFRSALKEQEKKSSRKPPPPPRGGALRRASK